MRRRLIAVLVSAAMLFAAPGYAFTAYAEEETLPVEEADLSAESSSVADDMILEVPDETALEDANDIVLEDSGELASESTGDGSDEDGGLSQSASDDFVAGIEEVATKNYAAGEDYPEEAEEFVAYDTATETLDESALASAASRPNFVLFRILSAGYTDSYGAQLTGNAKVVYDAMVAACVGVCDPRDTEVTLNPAITFRLTNYSSEWNKDADEGYQEGMSGVRYEVQSAYCAFMYDYPQVFWMGNFTYGMRGSIARNTSTGEYRETISSITLMFSKSQLYEGAAAETAQFEAAVDAAVSEIKANLPEIETRRDIVLGIHDYLCEKIVYQENTYAHSAVGVFLKGGKVVCEGYAKAFKVLCDRFGILSVLIVGDAGEAHMWNYVKMEDGNWYLVDATWDDRVSGISYKYFLAGSQTVGFNNVTIGEERKTYTVFSTDGNSKSFTLPVLCANEYQEPAHVHEWTLVESKAATCMACGYLIYHCSGCESVGKSEIAKSGHVYPADAYVYNNDATALQDGTKTAYCAYGCGSTDTVTAVGTKLPATVAANAQKLILQEGQATSALQVSGLAKGDYVKSIESLDKKLVKVTASGKIKAKKKNGTARLLITLASGTTMTVKVKVQSGAVKTKKIYNVAKNLTMRQGTTAKLSPKLKPITSQQKITYTSSNKKVVSVSASGKLKAKRRGTATITVKSGSKKVKCKVKVN